MIRVALAVLLTNLLVMTEADTGSRRVALKDHNSGGYTVKARLGDGANRDFLFDTGSSLVVLSPQTFKELASSFTLHTVRTIRGAMADGKIVEADVFEIPLLTIDGYCSLHAVEAVVLPGADRNILGLSALSQLGDISIQFDPPTLGFSACGEKVVSASNP